jgi:hypothetical protein
MARKRQGSGLVRGFLVGALFGFGAWVALDGLDTVRARLWTSSAEIGQ